MKNLIDLAKCFESKFSTAGGYRDRQSPAGSGSSGITEMPMGFSGDEPKLTQERGEVSTIPEVEDKPTKGFSRANILIGDYLKRVLDRHSTEQGKDLPAVVHVSVGGSSVGYFVYDPYASEYTKSGNYIDEIEITDEEFKEILSDIK